MVNTRSKQRPNGLINALPDEILDMYIFKYFGFGYWIANFAAVCQRWKHICENSSVEPKHIKLRRMDKLDLGISLIIVKKYQPTILTLNEQWRKAPKHAIPKIIEASKKLHTLITRGFKLNAKHINPSESLEQIKTLVIGLRSAFYHADSLLSLWPLFPNVKRLQLQSTQDRGGISAPPKLEELVVFYEDQVPWIENVPSNVKVTLIGEMPKNVQHNGNMIDVASLPYELYLRYFGSTKLQEACERSKWQEAANYLTTETSMEYEEYLYDYLEYRFPSRTELVEFSVRNPYYYADEEVGSVITTYVPYSPVQRMEALIYQREYGAALQILKQISDEKLKHSDSVHSAFRDLLDSDQITTEDIVHKDILPCVEKIIKNNDFVTSIEQFNKIASLRDWSTAPARMDSHALFWTMVQRGCIVDQSSLRYMKLRYILKDVTDPEKLFLVLSIPGAEQYALEMIRDGKIRPDISKGGISLLNHWISTRTTDHLFPPKSYFGGILEIIPVCKRYMNHIDPRGFTPLMSFMERSFKKDAELLSGLAMLLENGADPARHGGNQLSPFAILLCKHIGPKGLTNKRYTIIDLLLQRGVDINAPCMFERRMCSPLMIAVRSGMAMEIIRYLIALGALVDYKDQKGLSVVDCAKKKYENSFVNELASYCTE